MAWVVDDNAAMLTDLYELTMAASYLAQGLAGPATFDLFVRRLPEERNFLVVCGVEEALDYLERVRFTGEAISYLRSLAMFQEPFLEYLARFRFTGDAWAIPEGEVAFGQEPLLRVTAPLIEAQVVETFLLNCMTYQTMVASKAARVTLACSGRPYIDFSPRRDHGADAALRAAKAAWIGGAAGTSNVLAGQVYGLPLSGTMAHSYVLSFEHEIDAFRAYASDFPESAVLLIDTYDTAEGARKAAVVANEVRARGGRVQAVRLDSGDLGALAKEVRHVLDAAGCADVQIFASGDLDEYRISELLADGAPIDAFGVGTRLGTSEDASSLSSVYKLVEDASGPKMKLSEGKVTLPGRKQVWRVERDGVAEHDIIAVDGEKCEGRMLLEPVMHGGRRVRGHEALDVARARRAAAVAGLPARLRTIGESVEPYEVRLSGGLERLLAAERDAAH
ncbi:MAG: nicotinate phosphoribosyltransferase [Dehalococcoidia bacterium]